MTTRTKSILEELNTLMPSLDRVPILESRGDHIIESAINLIETVFETYGPSAAEDVEKRLLASIRDRDHSKFYRGVRRLK